MILCSEKEFPERAMSWIWLLTQISSRRAVPGTRIRERRSGQGRENAKTYLAQNPLICEEIENQVRELHGLEAQHVAPGEAAAAPAVNEAEAVDE